MTFTDDGVLTSKRSGESSEVLIRNKSVGESATKSSTYYIYGAGLEYEVSFDASDNESVKYFLPQEVKIEE